MLAVLVVALVGGAQTGAPAAPARAPVPIKPSRPAGTRVDARPANAGYGRLPIAFAANDGETDQRVRFHARGNGYSLLLTQTEAVLRLRAAESVPRDRRRAGQQPHVALPPSPRGVAAPSATAEVRMSLIGSDPGARIAGERRLPGTVNYLIGRDPSKWRSNVATFEQVRCDKVYPGIDLVFHGNQRQLEYDFVVAPGADLSRIRLAFHGARGMRLDAGDLVLTTRAGELRQQRPIAYQPVDPDGRDGWGRGQDGTRQLVAAHYVLGDDGHVGFAVPDYDHARPLVIDPVLVYSTYLGGAMPMAFPSGAPFDDGAAIAVDGSGSAFITGQTQSLDFPTVHPLQPPAEFGDIFVAKMNASGSALLYSTWIGGRGGDNPWSIAIDAGGSAYVTGQTSSSDFPLVNPLQPLFGGGEFLVPADAFVLKVNAAGTALVYSTYLGGSGNEAGAGVAVDVTGHAYVVGYTARRQFPPSGPLNDFPVMNAIQPQSSGDGDAFVAKLTPAGSSLVFSTYLGGARGDFARGVALGPSGEVWLVGFTDSADFPVVNPFQGGPGGLLDGFVAMLTADGQVILSASYLGGTDWDVPESVAVTSVGEAVVAGWTLSADFPTVNALQPTLAGAADAFVMKIEVSGATVVYATLLGGGANDYANAVAVDADGQAFITGHTGSVDLPLDAPVQAQLADPFADDAFVSELSSDGTQLLFSTFLGGRAYEAGQGIAVDRYGSAYITGSTQSGDFPATLGAFQTTYAGASDAFVAKLGAPFPCGPDVTAGLRLSHLPPITIPATPWLFQLVIVVNTSGESLQGPLTYVLTDLTNAASIGTLPLACGALPSTPSALLHGGDDEVLSPGEATATLLLFYRTGPGHVDYTPVVLNAGQ
jgi:hypothetical protein